MKLIGVIGFAALTIAAQGTEISSGEEALVISEGGEYTFYSGDVERPSIEVATAEGVII